MRMDTGEESAMWMGDKGRSPGLQPIKGGHNTLIDLYPMLYTAHTFLYTSVTLSPDNRLSAVKLAPCRLLCAVPTPHVLLFDSNYKSKNYHASHVGR